MKKIVYILMCMLCCCGAANAQVRESVSVLGDSYSTFEGYVSPKTNEMWYYAKHGGNTDVEDVTQTWWHQVVKQNGWKLCQNNSYSGAASSAAPKPDGYNQALIGLILAIAGLVFLWVPVLGIGLAVAGLVLSIVSKNKGFAGGMRTAAFIISLISIISSVIGTISCIACIACGGCYY